ncbi:MAG: hypothetical protein RLZ35_1095 [Pseudomonadota bacterium]|jgi:hypothetical protein
MFKNILIVLLCIFSFSQAKILIFNDISVEPIHPASNPDLHPNQPLHRKGVYLASYVDGDEVFFKNQHALALSALNKGVDFIFNYRRSHLDPNFLQQNAYILNQPQGKGVWLWKPWIILKTLQSIPEDAVLIYADSGLVFRNSVAPLIALSDKHDIILSYFDQKKSIDNKSLETHASRKTLEYMKCDTKACRQSPHLWAGFMILRNTPNSRAFVKRWLTYAKIPKLLLGNAPDNRPPYPSFSHQLHDETLLSVLHAKEPEGKHLIEVYDLYNHYIFWHHRRNDKPLAQNNGYYTILPRMFKQIRGIERSIINAYPMRQLRQYLLEHYPTIYRSEN